MFVLRRIWEVLFCLVVLSFLPSFHKCVSHGIVFTTPLGMDMLMASLTNEMCVVFLHIRC